MLVMSRKAGETIVINDNIEVEVIQLKGERARIGIRSPQAVPIHRKEVFDNLSDQEREEQGQFAATVWGNVPIGR